MMAKKQFSFGPFRFDETNECVWQGTQAIQLAEDVVRIEEVCDGLARRHHFLLPAYLAELPDGIITPRYRFIHALYLNVLYKRQGIVSNY